MGSEEGGGGRAGRGVMTPIRCFSIVVWPLR